MKKMIILFITISLMAGILIGCSLKTSDSNKKNIDFTICDETRVPEELKQIIDDKKEKEFRISYVNNAYLYIVVGYGQVEKSDHKIIVEDFYLAEDGIHIKTMLKSKEATSLDADKEIDISNSMTPYLVIKCEKYDVPVIFDVN